MPSSTLAPTHHENPARTGRWVTAKLFGHVCGFSEDVLGNWRWADRKAKRTEARDGYPVYKYFGGAVRYWLELPVRDWEELDAAKAKERVSGSAA